MSTRDVNLYESFEDWFLANVDADGARELREHGASCGIPGLCYYAETIRLFHAFKCDIERLATDNYDTELWKIAKQCEAHGMVQLMNALVWLAAERLSHKLESHFDAIENDAEAEQESGEGETNEI